MTLSISVARQKCKDLVANGALCALDGLIGNGTLSFAGSNLFGHTTAYLPMRQTQTLTQ
jgi:hypothetical protein